MKRPEYVAEPDARAVCGAPDCAHELAKNNTCGYCRRHYYLVHSRRMHLKKYGKGEKIKRECLKCGGKFLATGRFNRICSGCRENESHREYHRQVSYVGPAIYYGS